MHVFPARVPAAEVRRADVVETRVARKVAPLFGLGDDLPPFHRSWVCDYTALSLAEIGRGAPHPDRTERSRLDADPPRPPDGAAADWAWAGRAVWSPPQGTPPGALTNATLNRYGPDTKAAAVLSAANRLLRDATAAVAAAGRHLAETGCDAEIRLAVWAGLVLEVYRAQPALVVAAIQARQVQRSLSARWGEQVDRVLVTGPDAPSEIHPPPVAAADDADPDGSAARWRPTSFDLVDATLPRLGLADDPVTGPGLMTVDALDDVASAWCQRLLGVGRAGRGVVWLTEETGGSRRVHAMVRVGAVVAPFVAASLGSTPAGRREAPPVLPVLPTADSLAAAPLPQRRAHLLTAHVAANYVRYRDELLADWPALRALTRELVDAAVQRCANVLDPEDPVSRQLDAYAAYLGVWDPARFRDRPADAAGPPGGDDAAEATAIRRLVASQHRVTEAWRAGRLDPGAASYLLEIGVVALRHATDGPSPPADGGPTPATVRSWWSAILKTRGLDPGNDLAELVGSLGDAQVFHLHHYAAWLGASGRRADLRRALAIQERVATVRAEVTRREPAGFAAKSAASRAGYELAAELATDLALATPQREHGARTRVLADAVRHVHAVLAGPDTDGLLPPTGPPPATRRTAQVVARTLCVAASHGVTVPAGDAAAAITLLDAVPDTPDPAWSAAADEWRARLARIAAGSGPDI